MPSLPISLAIASARGRLSVNVSSSKKNSLTCGKAFFAQRHSSITWPDATACDSDVRRPSAARGRRCSATCSRGRCRSER